jgi:peptide-methionine (S)-S-oxide reductase
MLFGQKKTTIPSPEDALPGRADAMSISGKHHVHGTSIVPPFDGFETAIFGFGCFWGVERMYWEAPGVHATAVGYAAGSTPNPSYEEVCSGGTGHNEVVLVVFDPGRTDYLAMLRIFWEGHDPTQGMRQGNDAGTQYRSGIYFAADDQRKLAEDTRDAFQLRLRSAGRSEITTEIQPAATFYYAEEYHQQYLAKVPNGYCGLGGTGVTLPEDATYQK